jgi:hypothetical protein
MDDNTAKLVDHFRTLALVRNREYEREPRVIRMLDDELAVLIGLIDGEAISG